MARTIPISTISPSGGPGTPGQIVIEGSFRDVFKGKFYRTEAGDQLPFYSSVIPAGYSLIRATTFDIIENPDYKGRYTVYTPVNAGDEDLPASSTTTIRVNEVVPAPSLQANATIGSVTNISTYLIAIEGQADLIIPPTTTIYDQPIDLFGRDTSGWGEGYAQNFVNLTQNNAAALPPSPAYKGQSWYDVTAELHKTYNGTSWDVTNHAAFGITYRHTQSSPNTDWTVVHNQNLPSPFIAFVQVFKDIGSSAKMILPQDITFVDANTLTVKFSNAETGWVLVKP